ncbi:large subunit rRNA processing RRM protein, putative [Plasmodium knowlesi strain H]|uniref:Large subunit rRNA processing RRM protein, putative n=3 Tax=Plasmodium knowlesi TaxID=5850 RepID=A0A5K1UBP0_PLAKH|nr:RNA-binding protein 34, putative [Plasmodium knowlesi strain H]OTN68274.1 putative Large subunit rRNA processing RRM protein [Plasmodium knowlesi]CAA9987092.1 RNA-binding protein 34, putative [Plasmodium knowlesi strain H]SBO23825.1 large subunit rRNA processing RRM protein, putative [Plasmodium knowlesi strain H]SBO25600.1 large subunit rRNA processing RRM protein, putative [Plasmodium knowlesi strain H]VVS76566.1 RNA-binding protein 34, putative [Plasmodium knowlesi strain H]|eukprot:XP_002261714.1 RNA binding protein, putative [Plasmodium knowlesi strain H]
MTSGDETNEGKQSVEVANDDHPEKQPTRKEENQTFKKPNKRDKKIKKKKKVGKKKKKKILEKNKASSAPGGREEGDNSGSPLEMNSEEDQTEGNQISSIVSFLKRNEKPPRSNGEGGKANEKQATTKKKTKEKPRHKDRVSQEDKDKRTVFVGNLPLKDMHKGKLLKLLDLKNSAVESVRFRSQPMEEAYAGRKRLGVILKKFTDVKDNQNAMITLKKEESLPGLLKKNGMVYEGYVLRINMFGEKPNFNRKKSVCIKNLDRKINESDLYNLLKDVDQIKGIRILRDERTSVSTGVSFVLFENRSSVKKAIEMFHGHSVNGREIIVEKIQRAEDRHDASKDVTRQRKQVKRTIRKGPREEHKMDHGKGHKNGNQMTHRARRKKKYVRRKRRGGAATTES